MMIKRKLYNVFKKYSTNDDGTVACYKCNNLHYRSVKSFQYLKINWIKFDR